MMYCYRTSDYFLYINAHLDRYKYYISTESKEGFKIHSFCSTYFIYRYMEVKLWEF